MGGQACVLYGAAEFSKDFDFVLLLEDNNLKHFEAFIADIEGETIAVPAFHPTFLEKGHAIHFRAKAKGYENVRIDIMSRLRGLDSFESLWKRRSTVELLPDLLVEVLSLPDLVKAKKTQRDKDWPIIRRLVDVDYLRNRANPTDSQVQFWIQELRTPSLLIECCANHTNLAKQSLTLRSGVLSAAISADLTLLEEALKNEEQNIRNDDKQYWAPLIKELEKLRHDKN